eukprot:scaffold6195_cov170-Isochrysis_galbana.AAC.1
MERAVRTSDALAAADLCGCLAHTLELAAPLVLPAARASRAAQAPLGISGGGARRGGRAADCVLPAAAAAQPAVEDSSRVRGHRGREAVRAVRRALRAVGRGAPAGRLDGRAPVAVLGPARLVPAPAERSAARLLGHCHPLHATVHQARLAFAAANAAPHAAGGRRLPPRPAAPSLGPPPARRCRRRGYASRLPCHDLGRGDATEALASAT